LFAVRDTVKPGAASVVGTTATARVEEFFAYRDNALTATSIAAQIGIAAENVFAEARPEQKAEFVKKLQQRGERVAFVGDGINDAPALEQADLGIAVSRASDVAREAADIILLKSEIEAVPEALGLARATLRTIKQNLFWAFFLQRDWCAAGGAGLYESRALRRGDGSVRSRRDRQRAAAAEVEVGMPNSGSARCVTCAPNRAKSETLYSLTDFPATGVEARLVTEHRGWKWAALFARTMIGLRRFVAFALSAGRDCFISSSKRACCSDVSSSRISF